MTGVRVSKWLFRHSCPDPGVGSEVYIPAFSKLQSAEYWDQDPFNWTEVRRCVGAYVLKEKSSLLSCSILSLGSQGKWGAKRHDPSDFPTSMSSCSRTLLWPNSNVWKGEWKTGCTVMKDPLFDETVCPEIHSSPSLCCICLQAGWGQHAHRSQHNRPETALQRKVSLQGWP